jgi:rhodanese-related sulfurtransferase
MAAFTLQELDASTAKSWLDQGDTVLLDVREPGEYAREHIPGAQLVPLSTLNPANLNLKGTRRVIVHCASGARSARAAERLHEAGIEPVAHLKGGLPAWREAGYEVIVDTRAPLPIMRQVQLAAGALVLLSVALGIAVHAGFFALSAMVGAGLVFAGATGWCGMAMLLARLPYNKRV